MPPALAVLWTLRLACWPDEVEGPASPPVEVVPPAAISPAEPAPSPALPPSPAAAASPPPPSAAAAAAALPKPRPPEHPRAGALPTQEEARYDVRYGLLGSVGEVTLSAGAIDAGADGIRVVRVRGAGQGSVLGLGSMRRRIESELDLTSLAPRKWTAIRLRANEQDPAGTVDSGARGPGNAWTLERAAPGQPPARQTVTFQSRTVDPLGLLWLLRTAPPGPGKSETHQILDGMTLWRVDVTGASSAEILAGGQTALRLDGTLAPIQFDGRADPERPTRTFTLWMSDGPGHLPLRLEVPVGPGDVVFTLTQSRKLAAASPRGDGTQVAGPAPGARNL